MKLILATTRSVALAAALGQSAGSADLPSLRARTLSGTEVVIPSVFSGKIGVLLLGFSKRSAAQTAPWEHYLSAVAARDNALQYYEGAILGDGPSLFRGFVVSEIRKGTASKEQEHFLVLTQPSLAWKTVAGPGDADEAYVLVSNSTGTIMLRLHGSFSTSAANQVAACIAQLKRDPSRPCS